MLKITVLFQVLIANKMLDANEFSSIKSDESTQKFAKLNNGKLAKTRKLSKS